MSTIQQIMRSIGLDQVPPDILGGIGVLIVILVLWRMTAISVKTLIGTAGLIVVLLLAWRAYLWLYS